MATRSYTPFEVAEEALPYLSEGGRLTPFRALARFFDTAELRTRATPPVQVEVARLGVPGGTPNPLLRWLKPTVVLRGAAGEYTLAPHGEAPEGRAGVALLLWGGAMVLGGAFAAGYLLGRGRQE